MLFVCPTPAPWAMLMFQSDMHPKPHDILADILLGMVNHSPVSLFMGVVLLITEH